MYSTFRFNPSTISELSSIESNFSGCSGDLSFSRNLLLTPMKHRGNREEHEFSIAVSGDKIDLDKSTSVDSFSSNPESKFNKGDDKFIAILEKQLEALRNIEASEASATGLLFEKIVIDMLDLGIEDKVLTSTDIPDILDRKGWDFQQVASTWRVGTGHLSWNTWNDASLDYLCGRHCLGKVWGVRKDNHLTDNVKRRRESGDSPVLSLKLPKFDGVCVTGLAMADALKIDASTSASSFSIDSK